MKWQSRLMQWTITDRIYFDFLFNIVAVESIRIVQFLGLFCGIALVGSSPVYPTYVSIRI